MSLNRVRTPCIGVCSTTFGDTVCRGCKRFLHEIVNWNGYSEAQKALVWQRLDTLLRLTVANYLTVEDPVRLRSALDYQNIRYQTELSPEGWLPELLKAAGSKPLQWEDYGVRIELEARGLSARELYDLIHAELYALAQAHYDRSHRRPAKPLVDLLKAEQVLEGDPEG